MYTSDRIPSDEEAYSDYIMNHIQPSMPMMKHGRPLSIIIEQPLQNQIHCDIYEPSVFFQHCVPLQNRRWAVSYPSLQQMIEREEQEIGDRPARAKLYFFCSAFIIIIGGISGVLVPIFYPDLKLAAIILLIIGAASVLGLVFNYRTAFVDGYVKHAADIYYGRTKVGILFDPRDHCIKRIKYKPDYGMTKEKENEPLETRCKLLHDPLCKILAPQRICTFEQLQSIGWQIKRDSSGPDNYYLVLQYSIQNGKDYRKYKIDDYQTKHSLLRGYNKLRDVMLHVDPVWFSSGICIDQGQKMGTWRGRR